MSCTWKDNIDMERRLITVAISKRKPGETAKYKTIPMSQKLYETLRELSKVRSISGKVFDYDIHEVRYNWDQTCKTAKIADAHFHDCRHTFCSRLAQKGVNLYIIKELAGHESIKTTEIYAHLCPDSLRPSVSILDDFYKKSDDSPTVESETLTEAVNS